MRPWARLDEDMFEILAIDIVRDEIARKLKDTRHYAPLMNDVRYLMSARTSEDEILSTMTKIFYKTLKNFDEFKDT